MFSGRAPVMNGCRWSQWAISSDKGARKPMEEVAGSSLTQRWKRCCSDGKHSANVEVSPMRKMTIELTVEEIKVSISYK